MIQRYKKQYSYLLASLLFAVNPVMLQATETPAQTMVTIPMDLDAHIAECRQFVVDHAQNDAATLKEFDTLAAYWRKEAKHSHGLFDLHLMLKAVKFATAKHEGQFRDGGGPYIVHPLGVALSIWESGNIHSSNVIIAALLHDTVEDTQTTFEEIEELFGKRVRMTVEEVTDDPNLSGQEKRQRQVDHAPQMSLNAQLVKLADRLNNLSGLIDNPPANWTPEKVADYFGWGQKLLNALHGTNIKLEKQLQKVIRKYERTQVKNDRPPCVPIK